MTDNPGYAVKLKLTEREARWLDELLDDAWEAAKQTGNDDDAERALRFREALPV